MKKKVIIAVAAALLLVFALCLTLNLIVVLGTDEQIVDASSLSSEGYDAIVVLGAGIRDNERPSDMLEDRLKTAISLYRRGYAEVIVLSGDCSGEEYDEVSVMTRYCLDAGVPKSAIREDREGFSTIESLYNATKGFGYERIIVVTQEYHLYRAIYIAESLGASAHGVAADIREYRGQLWRDVREIAARIKDLFLVNLAY